MKKSLTCELVPSGGRSREQEVERLVSDLDEVLAAEWMGQGLGSDRNAVDDGACGIRGV